MAAWINDPFRLAATDSADHPPDASELRRWSLSQRWHVDLDGDGNPWLVELRKNPARAIPDKLAAPPRLGSQRSQSHLSPGEPATLVVRSSASAEPAWQTPVDLYDSVEAVESFPVDHKRWLLLGTHSGHCNNYVVLALQRGKLVSVAVPDLGGVLRRGEVPHYRGWTVSTARRGRLHLSFPLGYLAETQTMLHVLFAPATGAPALRIVKAWRTKGWE